MRRSAFFAALLAVCCAAVLSGCGYTTKSLLPEHIKTVYVENFKNEIDLTEEISRRRAYKLYKPALEVDITNAVIDRFIFDGSLKISRDPEDADAILSGSIIEYVKEPLRYDDSNEDVIEFRVRVVISAKLMDIKAREPVWQVSNFAGESTYRTSGSLLKTEDTAKNEAVEDLARRLVEKTIEVW
ncbi:MAG: LPS assembly lipoprotein LptE [Candidatus Omnitrophota bacterium]